MQQERTAPNQRNRLWFAFLLQKINSSIHRPLPTKLGTTLEWITTLTRRELLGGSTERSVMDTWTTMTAPAWATTPTSGLIAASRTSRTTSTGSRTASASREAIQLDIKNSIEYSIEIYIEFYRVSRSTSKLNRIFYRVFNIQLN